MSTSLISMAFLTGLMGAGHCIGMCGGLVSALS
ncbi:MAG: sulfite exporter TauE/SafE family protein, partial [Gammaproteobacteria bacterium]|nr:sulfite exporter TauE/SafE family protein [Gammaproteobacteria bacterium]NIR92699.1 sulfite exporter TauE/SafE family protein [Gammaproteobacteria bacterium]